VLEGVDNVVVLGTEEKLCKMVEARTASTLAPSSKASPLLHTHVAPCYWVKILIPCFLHRVLQHHYPSWRHYLGTIGLASKLLGGQPRLVVVLMVSDDSTLEDLEVPGF
jgi:hypothetical protein